MVTDPIHENATGSYLSGTIFRVMLNPENGRRERHRMEKRIAFPGSYYDTIRFEKWLDRRAAEGLRFKRFQNQGKILICITDFDPIFKFMGAQIAHQIAHFRLDDEYNLGKARADGVTDGIFHQDFAVGPDPVYLFISAIP